jgi:hypothetical protein
MNRPPRLYITSFFKSHRLLPLFVILLWISQPVSAQERNQTTSQDTIRLAISPVGDSSTLSNTDSISKADTTSIASKERKLGIKISKDALPAIVTTKAKDSAVLNIKEKVFYLYGEAQANYDDVQIKSGKLVFHQQSNLLMALPNVDTAGKKVSLQEFTQGQQKFTYDTLKYNFKSKRAIVRNAHSQYGEGFVISEQIKRNPDESIYGYRSIYTTCDLEHPHFGIKAKRIKVIPGRVIASGPANLEIMDLPTPFFLPFGMFPINDGMKQHSGFIIPAYSLDGTRGLGLQNGGYYFAINNNVGLTSMFDFYSKGSWASRNTVQYSDRYHYSGTLGVNYSFTRTGEASDNSLTTTKDFNVTWSHTVDPRATPNSTFSASVNFGTSSYNAINQVDLLSKLNNNYSSSISYGKTWQNKPYSFTAALRHSQNTGSGALSITLPELDFNLGQFSPFQRKVMIGTPKWYEKITVSYSANATNIYNTYDSLFSLHKIAFNDMDNGIKHNASIQATYNIFRFFNWNFSIPYTEYWNTKQLYLYPDTARNATDSIRKTGFFATRSASLNSSISTRIYGMLLFKSGSIAGIRHVLTPTIGFSYVPGYAHSPFNNLYSTYDIAGRPIYSSPYSYSPIGAPPATPDPSGSITFGLANTLQMKVRNKDSTGNATTKNISLIDNLSINGFYNLFADSCNLSDISTAFSTNIANKINLSASANFTPYVFVNGVRTGKFLIDDGKGLAQLTNANISLSMTFAGKKKNEQEQANAEKNNQGVHDLLKNGGYNNYYDFNIPWNLSVSGGLSLFRTYDISGVNTLTPTPNLIFRGGFNLTERWKVNADVPLEFVGFKKVDMGAGVNLAISRDLHCWQMTLNLTPFGYYRQFNFMLQVKSSILQDLKLTKRKSYYDNQL